MMRYLCFFHLKIERLIGSTLREFDHFFLLKYLKEKEILTKTNNKI